MACATVQWHLLLDAAIPLDHELDRRTAGRCLQIISRVALIQAARSVMQDNNSGRDFPAELARSTVRAALYDFVIAKLHETSRSVRFQLVSLEGFYRLGAHSNATLQACGLGEFGDLCRQMVSVSKEKLRLVRRAAMRR
jgi:hypothetical protein